MSNRIIITAIIVAATLVIVGVAFSAEPQVTIVPKWVDLNPDTKECGGFSEDRLILKIKLDNKEIIDEFCSSYGKADANIIKDTRGFNFLILKTAHGRGTRVMTQYLTVYRIENYLEELARFPVFEPLGRLSGAYYDYKIEKPENGGISFLITVRTESAAEDAEWFPKEKKRTISIK
jgi:hypothetical protein